MSQVEIRDRYIEECKIIHENSMYNAETHHVIALRCMRQARWFQAFPAATAALLAALVGSSIIPPWLAWVSALAAVISAVGTSLDPQRSYYDHLNAAKNFTVLKQKVRALRETYSYDMNENELSVAVKKLDDRYNELVKTVPPTDDKAFEKARGKIMRGIHDPD